ncbi:MAG: hypothetical protein M1834_004442 [Cirrosporium novae-zelandiae]|nr:MAG: hypothetical protein M1834_004442 [Cirrosporium novae-zelandiae]
MPPKGNTMSQQNPPTLQKAQLYDHLRSYILGICIIIVVAFLCVLYLLYHGEKRMRGKGKMGSIRRCGRRTRPADLDLESANLDPSNKNENSSNNNINPELDSSFLQNSPNSAPPGTIAFQLRQFFAAAETSDQTSPTYSSSSSVCSPYSASTSGSGFGSIYSRASSALSSPVELRKYFHRDGTLKSAVRADLEGRNAYGNGNGNGDLSLRRRGRSLGERLIGGRKRAGRREQSVMGKLVEGVVERFVGWVLQGTGNGGDEDYEV